MAKRTAAGPAANDAERNLRLNVEAGDFRVTWDLERFDNDADRRDNTRDIITCIYTLQERHLAARGLGISAGSEAALSLASGPAPAPPSLDDPFLESLRRSREHQTKQRKQKRARKAAVKEPAVVEEPAEEPAEEQEEEEEPVVVEEPAEEEEEPAEEREEEEEEEEEPAEEAAPSPAKSKKRKAPGTPETPETPAPGTPAPETVATEGKTHIAARRKVGWRLHNKQVRVLTTNQAVSCRDSTVQNDSRVHAD